MALLNDELKQKIQNEYNISLVKIDPAPRQFVAETWFIETDKNQKYFVKVVDKPLFIPEIIDSLPTLDSLRKAGIDRITYPIANNTGQLYSKSGDILIVLYNFIDAEQSYDYSEASLGELLAQIHMTTPRTKATTPEENYDYVYKNQFETQFQNILNGQFTEDDILVDMQRVLKKFEKRVRKQYEELNRLSEKMVELDLPKVITHGDAGGNTLVKAQHDIYIIDWDGILLSPAERDTWVPTHDFLEGYRRVNDDFVPNPTATAFYTLMYYFRSMAQYFGEIISEKPEAYRRDNLRQLEYELYEGWMVPYLKKVGAYFE
jgi:fructosamine-3-kinase